MDSLTTLRELGLTEYETKVYIALTGNGVQTVSSLAKRANVPRNKTYEALERLRDRGLVLEQPTRPKRYRAANPERLTDLLAEQERTLEQRKKAVATLVHTLAVKTEPAFQDTVWVLKGQDAVMRKINESIATVKKEQLSCTRSSVDDAEQTLRTEQAIKRGVHVRIIGAYTPKNRHLVQKWLRLGVEFRVYNEKQFGPHGVRFTVFDETVSRITIGSPEIADKREYLTIWSESPSMARLLKRQFEEMWTACTPIKKET